MKETITDADDRDTPSNKFSALHLDELGDDEELCEPDATLSPEPRHTQTAANDYDVAPQDHELDLAILMVFEDAHRIRAEMQRVWNRLRTGEITLMHATLAVGLALQLVRRAGDYAIRVYEKVYLKDGDELCTSKFPTFTTRPTALRKELSMDAQKLPYASSRPCWKPSAPARGY